MSHLDLLKQFIADAPSDERAETLLRTIVQYAAEDAPVDVLVELAEVLISTRENDQLLDPERN